MLFGVFLVGATGSVVAQEHGMSVTKGCNFNVRVCEDEPGAIDYDCQDENQCLIPDCDESLPRDLICTFTAENADEYFDTLTIPVVSPTSGNPGAYDIVFGDTTTQIDWGDPEISIILVDGDADCAGGNTALPCRVGAGLGAVSPTDPNPGRVRFQVVYRPTAADWATQPIDDEGHVISFDECDGPESEDGVNCTTEIESDDDGSTTSALKTGCLPPTPVVCPPDDDLCTEDFECDPATGLCPPPGPPLVCPPDDDLCTEDFECDPTTGLCPPPGPPLVCPPDDDLCTEDFECDPCTEDFECDPTTGECPPPGPRYVCLDDAGNPDICQECDPVTGECVDADPLPPECIPFELRCRTPGFWATHGGTEKNRSTNITGTLIADVGSITVCGETITHTGEGYGSALEAMCVAVKGDPRLQVIRQKTAAALNCILSSGDPTCSVDPYLGDLMADCEAACDNDDTTIGTRDLHACIDELDCFNNGGYTDNDGQCVYAVGMCHDSGEWCWTDDDCNGDARVTGDYCVAMENCHDRDLCPDYDDDMMINDSDYCFEPPGPAGSSGMCNVAKKNDFTY